MHLQFKKKHLILSEYFMLGKKHKQLAQHASNALKQCFL